MAGSSRRLELDSVLTLSRVRSFIRASSFRGAVALFSVLYIVGSLFEGGMVVLANLQGGYSWSILLGSPNGQWWNYPGLLLLAPWGVVTLPLFPTIAMLVVGVGVGLGMTVALLLTIRLLRPGTGRARTKAVGAVTGLTPTMLSLVTLGACCSTTAVATAGVGLVADASATSVSNLLLNNWYLGVFQIVIVWVSLLGQEMLLAVYGGLYGSPTAGGEAPSARPGPDGSLRWLAAGALRVGLLGGGLLWSLAMLSDWTTTDLGHAGAGMWVSWLVQHQLVALLAVGIALFPRPTLLGIERLLRSALGRTFALVLLAGGASLLLWLPPPLPAWGLESLPDRLLGLAGAGAAWGALPVGPGGLAVTAARWAVEYVLLGSVVVVAVGRPRRLLTLLEAGSGVPAGLPAEPSPGFLGATPGACPPRERSVPAPPSVEVPASVRRVTDGDGT